jgi:hypothetical protein
MRDHVAGTLQQKSQNLERLLLQLDPDAAAAQVSRLEIQFKDPESHRLPLWSGFIRWRVCPLCLWKLLSEIVARYLLHSKTPR